MVARRALVLGSNGGARELPDGDTLSPDPEAWLGYLATNLDIVTSVGGIANACYFARVVRGPALTVSKLGITIVTASGNYSLSVHRNTGSGMNAAPGPRVATTGALAATGAGYVENALDVAVAAAVGDWFGLSVDNTTIRIAGSAGGTIPASTPTVTNPVVQYQATGGHPAPSAPTGLGRVAVRFMIVGVA